MLLTAHGSLENGRQMWNIPLNIINCCKDNRLSALTYG
jgi:hypothetical protein